MATESEEVMGYHASTPESIEKHKKLRGMSIALHEEYSNILPHSRQRSLALTKLEEALMFANAAVAINETPLTLGD